MKVNRAAVPKIFFWVFKSSAPSEMLNSEDPPIPIMAEKALIIIVSGKAREIPARAFSPKNCPTNNASTNVLMLFIEKAITATGANFHTREVIDSDRI